jgi:hypothetical protein
LISIPYFYQKSYVIDEIYGGEPNQKKLTSPKTEQARLVKREAWSTPSTACAKFQTRISMASSASRAKFAPSSP